MRRQHQLILFGSSGSSISSSQDIHNQISPPAVEETMPNWTDCESPAPSEPFPTKEPTHLITRRASKRSQVELDPPEMADPRTPAPCQKRTKRQAKWAIMFVLIMSWSLYPLCKKPLLHLYPLAWMRNQMSLQMIFSLPIVLLA